MTRYQFLGTRIEEEEIFSSPVAGICQFCALGWNFADMLWGLISIRIAETTILLLRVKPVEFDFTCRRSNVLLANLAAKSEPLFALNGVRDPKMGWCVA